MIMVSKLACKIPVTLGCQSHVFQRDISDDASSCLRKVSLISMVPCP